MADLEKRSKDDLIKLCKINKQKNYSKLKKDGLVELLKGLDKLKLVDDGTNDTPKKKKEPSERKPTVPSLEKKLADYFKPEDLMKELKEIYSNIKEVDDVNKIKDKDILDNFSDDINTFISEISAEDAEKYIKKYGAIKAVHEYLKSGKKQKLSGLSEEEINVLLAKFVFEKEPSAKEPFIKNVRKVLTKRIKDEKKKEEKAAKAASNSSPKKAKKVSHEEEEEEEEEEESEAEKSE